MPFSHYAYSTVNGRRQPTMLYQLDGESVDVKRSLIHRLSEQNETLATIPKRLSYVIDCEQLAVELSY